MSKKYIGGLITKTPVTPAGPYQNGAASGVWTLEQAEYYIKQGIWPIAGNVEQIGQQTYVGSYDTTGTGTLQDTYNFTVPAGVTSISAVCIGSGGSGSRSDTSAQSGRAGDLRWSSNIAVTPGETLTVLVAQGTAVPSSSNPYVGNSSEIKRGSTVLLSAVGGGQASATSGTASSTIGGYIGGGNGGNSGTSTSTYAAGGGGTGGYNGNGGSGMNGSGSFNSPPVAGSGAAYGGNRGTASAQRGGGVNVIGIGTTATSSPEAGSYGCYGEASLQHDVRGMYGAGGGGNDSASGSANPGAPGAVRIIWGGGRTFPSNAGDYLPMSANSFTEIELRFKQVIASGSTISTAISEIEILDETNINIMRSPSVLTAVAGSNTLSFSSLSNNQFGFNSATVSATDAQTFNSGTVEASYFGIYKTGSDTVSLLVKLSSARKIKQIKISVGSVSGNDVWFIPYIEVYGNGTLLGTGCPVPTYNSPASGNVTSTITFT